MVFGYIRSFRFDGQFLPDPNVEHMSGTQCTETSNRDGTWLREISSRCCLTTASKTRQLLLNKIYIPFLPSLRTLEVVTDIAKKHDPISKL